MTPENTAVSVLVAGKMNNKENKFKKEPKKEDELEYICVEPSDSESSEEEDVNQIDSYNCKVKNRFTLLRDLNAVEEVSKVEKKKKNPKVGQSGNDQKVHKMDRHSGSKTTIRAPNKRGGDGPYNFGDPQKSQVEGLKDVQEDLQQDNEEKSAEQTASGEENNESIQAHAAAPLTLTEFIESDRAKWLNLNEMNDNSTRFNRRKVVTPMEQVGVSFRHFRDFNRNSDKADQNQTRHSYAPKEVDVGNLVSSDFPNLGTDVPSKSARKATYRGKNRRQ
ncbi:hypothetical protein SNEBB_007793 [Seison nebaliae]|nr:hypothetical protein SNEBB_007793 [Seison nebaliae]